MKVVRTYNKTWGMVADLDNQWLYYWRRPSNEAGRIEKMLLENMCAEIKAVAMKLEPFFTPAIYESALLPNYLFPERERPNYCLRVFPPTWFWRDVIEPALKDTATINTWATPLTLLDAMQSKTQAASSPDRATIAFRPTITITNTTSKQESESKVTPELINKLAQQLASLGKPVNSMPAYQDFIKYVLGDGSNASTSLSELTEKTMADIRYQARYSPDEAYRRMGQLLSNYAKQLDETQGQIKANEQREKEILSLLKKQREEREAAEKARLEKRSKMSAAQKWAGASSDDDGDESQEGNPFSSAISDGKAQFEMLLSGLIEPRVDIDSVILPDQLRESILNVVAQQDNGKVIFEDWGFEETMEKGRGMTMLFAGLPGTGKTLMAEAIAKRCGFLFWNIGSGNLDGMFVGDFEKSVTFVFKKAREIQQKHAEWEDRNRVLVGSGENAEITTLSVVDPENAEEEPPKGIVLLFDEADSIVAARDAVSNGQAITQSAVKVGQINHFLRQLEEFDGICIFATNRVVSLDSALERRISLIADFPFPDAAAREKIWKRMIPAKAPLAEDIDLAALAKYEIAGGHIKNAVLGAARKAANAKVTAIGQAHFLEAVQEVLKGTSTFKGQHRPTSTRETITAIYGDDNTISRMITGIDNPLWN